MKGEEGGSTVIPWPREDPRSLSTTDSKIYPWVITGFVPVKDCYWCILMRPLLNGGVIIVAVLRLSEKISGSSGGTLAKGGGHADHPREIHLSQHSRSQFVSAAEVRIEKFIPAKFTCPFHANWFPTFFPVVEMKARELDAFLMLYGCRRISAGYIRCRGKCCWRQCFYGIEDLYTSCEYYNL